MTCLKMPKIMFTASGELPEPGRPVKLLPWPVRSTSIIWSRWRKCWAIKFPCLGPQMIGSWPTHPNLLFRSADRVSEDPGDGGVNCGQPNGLNCQKNQSHQGFRGHFSVLALNLRKPPPPIPQQILRHRLPKNGRGAKRGALFGAVKNPGPAVRPKKPEVPPQYVSPGSSEDFGCRLISRLVFTLDKVLIFT